jgi:hypothetical protein
VLVVTELAVTGDLGDSGSECQTIAVRARAKPRISGTPPTQAHRLQDTVLLYTLVWAHRPSQGSYGMTKRGERGVCG